MTSPHDGRGRRRAAQPPQRSAPTDRGVPQEPPQRGASGEQPAPRRSAGRRGRRSLSEPAPPPRPPRRADERAVPPGPPPVERAPRPPARRAEQRPRRRRSPNDGVPVDENPTDVLELDLDEAYDDLVDADAAGDEPDRGADDERELPRDDEPDTGRQARHGRRFLGWLAALTVLVLLAGGAYYGARELLGFGYADYDGPGETDVLLQVEEGDSTRAIATKLAELDVVASAEAFVAASEGDQRVLGIQPGYYVLKTKLPGTDAVARLVQDEARVGQLQLRAGTQLDDITQPDGSVTPGVFSLLSKASCADLNGKSTCVRPQRLREVAATTDLAELGVPPWAAGPASEADPRRRLEGLIAPGVYDVRPGWDARTLLSEVLRVSTIRMQAAGLPDGAGSTPYSPYQVLIIASLVEREAVEHDFTKVARVIYNRLDIRMHLGLDSTVNYVLDRPEVRTTGDDRAREGPYNTYRNYGLPPTPISAPSAEAIKAAREPAEGDYLYFVKCETNGLSCFSKTQAEHDRKAEDARNRGVY